MKISYNWLKEYVFLNNNPIALEAEEVGKVLTDCGLEVESVEKIESIKGGLLGIVVGEVKTKEKHPDADRLSVTTVDVGADKLLNIVCGAPNVAAGQKVLVATIGTKLYPTGGESFEIKKSKIRGQLSEGMICAEDEIGLGNSHEGIMVLDSDAVVGTPAKNYLLSKETAIQDDYLFEIGLTPNRADAASHIGVARDLVAALNCKNRLSGSVDSYELKRPVVNKFKVNNTDLNISVEVEDNAACARYSGLTISNVQVKESPEWLKTRLKTIGVRPINNIVDITNYVLHEVGQPMHAFDTNAVKGNKVLVKKLDENTPFVTLDDQQRKLSSEDLMVCNAEEPMCIAGVFGGKLSGVTEATTSIFLESAYFNSTTVRKTSKRHDLKTDASFRFERGTDPNITVFALKRAALLIKEVAGGEVTSEIVDVYPTKIENFKVSFSFIKCEQLIGKNIEHNIIKGIIKSLGIEIEHEGNDALLLSVPSYKVDVQREQDVIEEVLRIYGYNNIEIPATLRASIQYAEKPDKEKIQQTVSELLSNNGFYETMCLSLTRSHYAEKIDSLDASKSVMVLNPLSSDLNAMRQTLLFSGLETIAYNQNRKNSDVKIYEFGKTYAASNEAPNVNYIENKHLALFISGRKQPESWNAINDNQNFYSLKGAVNIILQRLGIVGYKSAHVTNDAFSYGLAYLLNKKTIVELGAVSSKLLKEMDVKLPVFYADFNWDLMIDSVKNLRTLYSEVPKYPEVRRDLALLIDKKVCYDDLESLAYQAEKTLLKNVNLFDVYEGDKLPTGKKSYALSFTIQDTQATLNDETIDKLMAKLIKIYQEKAGAEIR